MLEGGQPPSSTRSPARDQVSALLTAAAGTVPEGASVTVTEGFVVVGVRCLRSWVVFSCHWTLPLSVSKPLSGGS